MNCKLAEHFPRCLVLTAALFATVTQAQDAAAAARSERLLARCIVAQQFDSPDARSDCLNPDIDRQAARLGPMLREMDQSCCNEAYAVALEALAAELGQTGDRRPAMSVDPSSLEAVLAKMDLREQTSSRSWWQRFVDWLDELLGEDDQNDSGLFDWLDKLQISKQAATVIRWTLYLMLLGIAALIIFNEMRVAGIFRRHARSPTGDPSDAELRRAGELRTRPTDIEHLAPLDQTIALFGSALDVLRAAGTLPPDDSLTNLELSRRLRPDDGLKRPFDQLRSSADRALYAEIAPDGDELKSLREAWRRIMAVADPASETVTS